MDILQRVGQYTSTIGGHGHGDDAVMDMNGNNGTGQPVVISKPQCAILSPAPMCFGHGYCTNLTGINNDHVALCACTPGWRSDGDQVFVGQCHIHSTTVTVLWIAIAVVGLLTLIFLLRSIRLAFRVLRPSRMILDEFRGGLCGWLLLQPRLRWISGGIVQVVAYVTLACLKLSITDQHVATHVTPTIVFTIGSVVYFVLAADSTMRCASVIDVRNASGLIKRLWLIVAVALVANTLSFILLFIPIYDHRQQQQESFISAYMITKLVIFAVLPHAQISTAKVLLAELEKHQAQTKQRSPMFQVDVRQQALIAHLPGVMKVAQGSAIQQVLVNAITCGWPAARLMTPYLVPFTILQSYIFVIKNTRMFVSTLLITPVHAHHGNGYGHGHGGNAPTAAAPSITSTVAAPHSPQGPVIHIHTPDHVITTDHSPVNHHMTVSIPGVLGSPSLSGNCTTTHSPGSTTGRNGNGRRISAIVRGSPAVGVSQHSPGLTPKGATSGLATNFTTASSGTTTGIPLSYSSEPLLIGASSSMSSPTQNGSNTASRSRRTGSGLAAFGRQPSGEYLSERSESPDHTDTKTSNGNGSGTPVHRPSIVGTTANGSPRASWVPSKASTGAKAAAAVMAAAKTKEQQQRSRTPPMNPVNGTTTSSSSHSKETTATAAAATVMAMAAFGTSHPPPHHHHHHSPNPNIFALGPSATPSMRHTPRSMLTHGASHAGTPTNLMSPSSTGTILNTATPRAQSAGALPSVATGSTAAATTTMIHVSMPVAPSATLACLSPPGPNHVTPSPRLQRPVHLRMLSSHNSFGASQANGGSGNDNGNGNDESLGPLGSLMSPPPQPSPSGIRPSQVSQMILATMTPDVLDHHDSTNHDTNHDTSAPTTGVSRSTSPQPLLGFHAIPSSTTTSNNNTNTSTAAPSITTTIVAPVAQRPALSMHMVTTSNSVASSTASRYAVT